jgi:endonuclease/exonuclease/phosphatase family metal-dependent hydrolase
MLSPMKLTSLNLMGRHKWRERAPLIVDYLQSTSPDIVFFQEVVYLPEESSLTQPAELNKKLGYEYEQTVVSRLQTSDEYECYREGLSVFSKHPITHSETLVLKQNKNDHLQRIVQLFDVKIQGSVVKYANVHFAQNPELAYDNLEELLQILESRGERRIIVGDFNMPDLKHVPLWQKEYMASTDDYYISFPTNDDRIDFVLIPKTDVIVDVSVSPDGLSDHRALTAEIRLNK